MHVRVRHLRVSRKTTLAAKLFVLVGLFGCGSRAPLDDAPPPSKPLALPDPRAPGGGTFESPMVRVCVRGSQCSSRVCLASGTCARATLSDGVMNDDETDVDCGGIQGKGCDVGQNCLTRRDCLSEVCTATGGSVLLCQAARSDDLVRNGDESDIDCGGTLAPSCSEGRRCGTLRDCASRVCTSGTCQAPGLDWQKNGTETDVDCGGPFAPPCVLGKRCVVPSDCQSSSCGGGRCVGPSPLDGQKNGTETDVDCGGRGNPTCAGGKACTRHSDCTSFGCAYDGHCAESRSCVSHFGGDTCGRGEVGSPTALHESCCATAPVPGISGVRLGKYGVTAGRVRTFLESVNGDVRGFVRTARSTGKIPADATLDSAWDAYLPTSFDGNTALSELSERGLGDPTPIPGIYTSVYRHTGAFIFRDNDQPVTGCMNRSPGTHTIFVPDSVDVEFGDAPHEVSRDILDTKGANCIDYLVAQAFCVWDGGRLQSRAEYDAAWGPELYPWGASPVPYGPGSGTYFGNRYPTATDTSLRSSSSPFAPGPNQSIELAAFHYSYEYPNLVATDYAVFIPAPGRLRGRGPSGHSLNDGLMELTGTIVDGIGPSPWSTHVSWSRNGSFEGHTVGGLFMSHLLNKYGKVGLRCAYAR